MTAPAPSLAPSVDPFFTLDGETEWNAFIGRQSDEDAYADGYIEAAGQGFRRANCAPQTLPSSHCLPARKVVETDWSGGGAAHHFPRGGGALSPCLHQ